MRTLRLCVLSVLTGLTLASCGDDPANVAGTYTISLTNGPNGCELDSWEEGATSTGTTVVITQEGDAISADVQGVAGTYLDLIVGSSMFEGTVSGSHLDARLTGRALTQGSCAYTVLIDMDADLDGDVLQGSLTWFAQTNALESCGILNTCRNTQAFNGTRPPGSGG